MTQEYGKYRFSPDADWFKKYVANWEIVLSHLKDVPAQGLEVGSFEGFSAVWVIENILTHPESTLTCIDTFDGGPEYDGLGLGTVNSREIFLSNVAKIEHPKKVGLREGKSYQELAALIAERREFDYVYIDASHIAADVLTDAVMSFSLLREGGIMIFDDYYWEEVPGRLNRPQAAIEAFLDIFQGRYESLNTKYNSVLIGENEQIYIQKTKPIGYIEGIEEL